MSTNYVILISCKPLQASTMTSPMFFFGTGHSLWSIIKYNIIFVYSYVFKVESSYICIYSVKLHCIINRLDYFYSNGDNSDNTWKHGHFKVWAYNQLSTHLHKRQRFFENLIASHSFEVVWKGNWLIMPHFHLYTCHKRIPWDWIVTGGDCDIFT